MPRHQGVHRDSVPGGAGQCPEHSRDWGAAEHGAAQWGQERLCQGSSTALNSRHRGHVCQRGCREPRCGSGLSLPLGRFTAQPGFITWKMLTLGIFFFSR